MDNQQQYVDFLNDVREALLDENVDQTPDSVNQLIKQNKSETQVKLDEQHALDNRLLESNEERRINLERDRQLLDEQQKQLEAECKLYDEKKRALTDEQQQFFSAFLEEQLNTPKRVGNKLVIENDTHALGLEKEFLMEEFLNLDKQKEQIKHEWKKLQEHKKKIKVDKKTLISEQHSFNRHRVLDPESLDTHVEQLIKVCEQLRAYDPRLKILPRDIFKSIPSVFREQLIHSYDMVLVALENVEKMSITSAYDLIDKVNKQATTKPESQFPVEHTPEQQVTSDQFDYDAYKSRLKKYHENIAEKHIAEMMERPEDADLLESYEPGPSNEAFFNQLQVAKEAETEEDGGMMPPVIPSIDDNFEFDTSQYMDDDAISQESYSTTQESESETATQPVASADDTATQPVASADDTLSESKLPVPAHSTIEYIKGLFYKQPTTTSEKPLISVGTPGWDPTPAAKSDGPLPVYPDDPFIPADFFDPVRPEDNPNVVQTASVYYNMRNKAPGRRYTQADPYDPYQRVDESESDGIPD